MNLEAPLKSISNYLEDLFTHSETQFLVDVKINQGNIIKVLLDADDGITIEKCAQVNKVLYRYIDEAGIFPGGNFSIEVSSPGVDEPLKLHRQYKKNIGRNAKIELNDGTTKEGKLVEVAEDEIKIEEKKGKGNKSTINLIVVSFNNIKHTKVQVTF